MCGIAGYIGEKASTITGNLSVINHRGPDDEGFYKDGEVWLAHKRLSIVDLTPAGHQPMISEDGNYVIVYNGEIYNHMDIRNELIGKGYTFNSSSDTQTLLYSLIHFGPSVLSRLNGIFAFAFYNKKDNIALIVRDQFGIKPLYYYLTFDGLGFSSEIKSLLHLPGFTKEVDFTAFFFYLQMLYAPGQLSPFRQVKKLLPGHYIRYNLSNKKYTVSQYYTLDFSKQNNNATEAELLKQLDEKLTKAVDRQLMSDVPLGYFLSGGLDSSLIVAIAKKLYPKQEMQCFTIATGDEMAKEGFADDLAYAKKVADRLSVGLTVIPASQNIEDFFDKMIWHLDEPQADPAPLHVYNIARGARQNGIKVLLGGTGGDDLFSGYRRHQAVMLEKYLKYTPGWLSRTLKHSSKLLSAANPASRRIKKVFNELGKDKEERLAGYFAWVPESAVASLFTKDAIAQMNGQDLPLAYWRSLLSQLPEGTSDLDKMLFLELRTFLPDHNLNYTDKMSMATGVEARVPYLDLELVNFATRLPVECKMKGKTTKYLLRKLAEAYLPYDVIYRPKTGFGAPVRTWLRTSLKQMMQERLSEERLRRGGIFDPNQVTAMINDTLSGKTDASYTIWSLMAIDSWMNHFTN